MYSKSRQFFEQFTISFSLSTFCFVFAYGTGKLSCGARSLTLICSWWKPIIFIVAAPSPRESELKYSFKDDKKKWKPRFMNKGMKGSSLLVKGRGAPTNSTRICWSPGIGHHMDDRKIIAVCCLDLTKDHWLERATHSLINNNTDRKEFSLDWVVSAVKYHPAMLKLLIFRTYVILS